MLSEEPEIRSKQASKRDWINPSTNSRFVKQLPFQNYCIKERQRIATSERNLTDCVRHCQGSEKKLFDKCVGNKL